MNATDLIDRLKRFLNSPDPLRATLCLGGRHHDAVEELVALLDGHSDAVAKARDGALEEAARMHGNVDPACDHNPHGCGAMYAIVQYRDKIRSIKSKGA